MGCCGRERRQRLGPAALPYRYAELLGAGVLRAYEGEREREQEAAEKERRRVRSEMRGRRRERWRRRRERRGKWRRGRGRKKRRVDTVGQLGRPLDKGR